MKFPRPKRSGLLEHTSFIGPMTHINENLELDKSPSNGYLLVWDRIAISQCYVDNELSYLLSTSLLPPLST